ncbi:MAG: putative bifunctional diguanylate cyclase/phosphodiesterase [Acidimicrobiales bacterium]
MTDSRSSVQALVRLLEVFSLDNEESVRTRAIDAAVESFDAVGAGIVRDGRVIESTGFGDAPYALVQLGDAGPGRRAASVEPFGLMHTLCIPIYGKPGTMFVLARATEPFSGEEAVVARAMVRLMRYGIRTIGALNDEHRMTTELASQVVANKDLAERLAARHGSFVRRLLQIQRAVTSAAPTDESLEVILDETGTLFGSDHVAIRRLDTEDDERSLWTANLGRADVAGLEKWGVEKGISGRAIAENHLVVDPSYRPRLLEAGEADRSAMAAPIYCHGEIAGTMTIVGGPDRVDPHDEEDREALLILSGYVSVAISASAIRRDLHASLRDARWRASHDSLTGLPNRHRMLELIEKYLRDGISPTVLYIDVDGFKTANDLYGHQAGDSALIGLAERLVHSVREDESVGRLAGDEFVVVLPPMDRADALTVARRVSSHMAEPLEIAGHQVRLPASIGVTLAEATTAEALLEAADHAMYRAKQLSGERIVFYDDELRRERLRRVEVEQQLRKAVVDMSEFAVHYQPIVTSPDNQTCGYEALLRWTSPAIGPVVPDEFITVAEQIGLISDIDLWVLRTVVEEASSDPTGSVSFSVNMSPATFLAPNLPQALAATIGEKTCCRGRLAIEITERVMLGDPVIVARNIEAIRRLGVAVVVDDFGTGYSSLSYLRSLRIDGLKIDRSFVVGAQHDSRGRAVLAAVIGLAHDLGLEPTAEGIETSEQLDLVHDLGCTRYQGFLFGRPAPFHDDGAIPLPPSVEEESSRRST